MNKKKASSIGRASYLRLDRSSIRAVIGSSGTDYSRPSTANSDRLSQFGHRISLFLQTLVLRGLLSREQAHRQEHMRGETRRVEAAFAVTSSMSHLVTWRSST
jgi:hypothetical protein